MALHYFVRGFCHEDDNDGIDDDQNCIYYLLEHGCHLVPPHSRLSVCVCEVSILSDWIELRQPLWAGLRKKRKMLGWALPFPNIGNFIIDCIHIVKLVNHMGVMPKLVKAVWKRTTGEGCISCSGQLEMSIINNGDAGAIRVYAMGIGLMASEKVYDAPYTIQKGQVGNWSFKVPYWSNQNPSITVKTGPAGSEAWTDQKTLTPTV